MSLRSTYWILFVSTFVISACGKEVRTTGPLAQIDPPLPSFCTEDQKLRWQYSQPDAVVSRSVDLLFVADSSLSLLSERERLAHAIPGFLAQLPSDADTRIAVMLGHAGSRWTGRLFSHRGDPRVINTQVMTPEQAEAALTRNLSCLPLELDPANGEMMMASLQRSLANRRFEKIQEQGFYRPEAALSVVFISDENDGCFDPVAHGYTNFPDFNESWFGLEKLAYRRHCVNEAGEAKVTPESVYDSLVQRFPGRRISLGGIVHRDPAHVRRFGEDSIGHGIIQLVRKSVDGVLMDIRTGDYSDALRRLGSIVTSQVQLRTEFTIETEHEIDVNSILVLIDGRRVSASYDSSRGVVTVRAEDAGGARSSVAISACPAAN